MRIPTLEKLDKDPVTEEERIEANQLKESKPPVV